MNSFSIAFSTSPLAAGGAHHVHLDPFTGFSTNSNQHQQHPHQPQYAHMDEVLPTGETEGAKRGDSIQISTSFDADGSSDVAVTESMGFVSRAIASLTGNTDSAATVHWSSLMDPAHPDDSADGVNALLSEVAEEQEEVCFTAIANCVTTVAHLQIVVKLNERFRKGVRDVVLQENLDELTHGGEDSGPLAAEMLVGMAQLGLVRVSGVIAVIESCLENPETKRAGLTVLGLLLHHRRGNERFVASIRSNKTIMLQMYALGNNPDYEYDVLAMNQLLGAGAGGTTTGPRPTVTYQRGGCLRPSAPTTRMKYIGGRDELVSAHLDGTVVLWGPPDASGEVVPRGTLDMPNECIPWAMAGPANGSFLALSGKPLPHDSAYGQLVQVRKQIRGDLGSKTISRNPLLRILGYSDIGLWTEGETIQRPLMTTLTAVAALPNSTVCSAESGMSGMEGQQHSIVVFSAATGQQVRSIGKVHTDYSTVLSTFGDSAALVISGSRDKSVKVFDVRQQQPNAAIAAGPALQLPNTHTDTISAIHTYSNQIFTTSLDGTLLVWDRRQTNGPISSRTFASPALDVALLNVNREPLLSVSTVRGLYLLSMSSMGAVDILPNKAYTQIVANDDTSALIAADCDGIQFFSFQRR